MSSNLVIRVYFVDDSFKTIAVSPTITAQQLVNVMGDKASIVQRETFSIFYVRNGEQRCLDFDELPCKLMVSEMISPDADFTKYTDKMEWEKLKKEWEKESKLVFKRRIFLKHKSISKEDENFLYYTYLQAAANVRDGTYPCLEGSALSLAGLQMQITFGDHNKKVHIQGFLRDKIDKFIPSPLLNANTRKIEDWEKDILTEHARHATLKKPDAMLQYLTKVREWTFYGCTFWEVQTVNNKDNSLPDKVTLAVSSTGIQLLKVQTKEPILIQRYADIYSWAYKKNAFAFVSGVLSKQKFQFVTLSGKDIAKTLQAYVEILLEEKKKQNSKPTQTTEVDSQNEQ